MVTRTPGRMEPLELVGLVIALEGFVMALAEAVLDQPGRSLDAKRELLATMNVSAKNLAGQLGKPEAQKIAESYADEMCATLAANLEDMAGDKPAGKKRRR